MRGNYYRKLSVEIMSENYQLVYYHAKIGIQAYPKIFNISHTFGCSNRKETHPPLPPRFRCEKNK